jgi:hypothetical protein
MPRFVWYAALQNGIKPVAELVFDATDMEWGYPFINLTYDDDDFRDAVATTVGAPNLQQPLAEVITPQFLAFLKEFTLVPQVGDTNGN